MLTKIYFMKYCQTVVKWTWILRTTKETITLRVRTDINISNRLKNHWFVVCQTLSNKNPQYYSKNINVCLQINSHLRTQFKNSQNLHLPGTKMLQFRIPTNHWGPPTADLLIMMKLNQYKLLHLHKILTQKKKMITNAKCIIAVPQMNFLAWVLPDVLCIKKQYLNESGRSWYIFFQLVYLLPM